MNGLTIKLTVKHGDPSERVDEIFTCAQNRMPIDFFGWDYYIDELKVTASDDERYIYLVANRIQ